MDKAYILIESTTHALMAKKDLESIGIDSQVVRMPKIAAGCSYSVMVSKSQLITAYDFLIDEGYKLAGTHVTEEEIT